MKEFKDYYAEATKIKKDDNAYDKKAKAKEATEKAKKAASKAKADKDKYKLKAKEVLQTKLKNQEIDLKEYGSELAKKKKEKLEKLKSKKNT